jgi:hypothetical protein
MSARPKTHLPILAAAMSENDLLEAVVSLAGELGWMVFHPRPGMTGRGEWLTFAAGRSGYPDLTLARKGTVLFAELKSEKGRLSEAQKEWGEHVTPVQRNPTHSHRIWRPTEWLDGTIERVLRRGW